METSCNGCGTAHADNHFVSKRHYISKFWSPDVPYLFLAEVILKIHRNRSYVYSKYRTKSRTCGPGCGSELLAGSCQSTSFSPGPGFVKQVNLCPIQGTHSQRTYRTEPQDDAFLEKKHCRLNRVVGVCYTDTQLSSHEDEAVPYMCYINV